jgi:hypothetical protein
MSHNGEPMNGNGHGPQSGNLRQPARGHGEKLTKKMHLAIAALLTTDTDRDAAVQARISERTLRTWKRLPAFAAALAVARGEILAGVQRKLLRYALRAADVLDKIANNDMAQDAPRVSAARATIELAGKIAETVELVERIERIEQLIEARIVARN